MPIAEILRQVRPMLSLAPAGDDLVGAEIELVTMEGRERRLRALLEPVRTEYNYVLIDTPPSLGILTLNALVAADSVLVPMQCEYYALEGLSALLGTINKVKAALRPALELEGLVLTMFDSRNRLSHEISDEVRKHFPEKVFRSVIPRSVRMSESPSHGLSVLEYGPKSAGAEGYRALAAEIVARARGGRAGKKMKTWVESDPTPPSAGVDPAPKVFDGRGERECHCGQHSFATAEGGKEALVAGARPVSGKGVGRDGDRRFGVAPCGERAAGVRPVSWGMEIRIWNMIRQRTNR